MGVTLKRGDKVIDIMGREGIVVDINVGTSLEDHGSINVWLSNTDNYGANNTESYIEYGWRECGILKLVEPRDVAVESVPPSVPIDWEKENID